MPSSCKTRRILYPAPQNAREVWSIEARPHQRGCPYVEFGLNVIKLEEEQHKQAIAHDDEQAKGALVDKEGPDHSGCDSGCDSRRQNADRHKKLCPSFFRKETL